MKKTNYFIYAILLFSLILSGNVYANSTGLFPDIFEPQAKNTDYLINNILMPIFGYGKGIDYEGNPFGLFSSIFLSGLIVLAAILTIYTVVTGMMDTANSGLLLKNKSSLSWTTLRSVTGVGLLIPLGKSGFCAIQYIVLWIAVQGVLFADSAWERFMSNPFEGNIQQTSLLKRQLLEHSQKIFLAKLCVKTDNEGQFSLAANGKIKEWGVTKTYLINGGAGTTVPDYAVNSQGNNATNTMGNNLITSYKFGLLNGVGISDNDVCGIITHTKNNTAHNGDRVANITTGMSSAIDEEKLTKDINESHYNQMKDWLEGSKIDNIVNEYIKDDLNKELSEEQITQNLSKNFQKIIDEYYTNVYSIALNSKKSEIEDEKFKKLKEEGFAAAGTFFFRLSNDLNTLSTAIHSMSHLEYKDDPLVVIEDIAKSKSGSGWDKIYHGKMTNTVFDLNEEKYNSMKKAIARLYGIRKTVSVSPTQKTIYAESSGANDLEKGMKDTGIGETAEALNEYLTSSRTNWRDSSEGGKIRIGNPLVQIQSLGNLMVNVTIAIMVGTILAGMVASGAKGFGKFPGLGMFAEAVASVTLFIIPFVMVVATSIFLPAIMMAFYVPLIPFILWMGALFGWLVLVVEALFGAPMWAVTFLSPDSNGFVGKQGQGYMLILTLFLRPVLMVLGFVAALHLLTPVVDMLNYFFVEAESTVRNGTNWFTWLISFIAMLIIYYITINKTVVQVFSLIHKVPDTLLQWIGGGHSQILGQYAEGVEKGVSNASLTAMAGANSAINRLGNIADRKIDGIKNKKGKENDLRKDKLNKFLDDGVVGTSGGNQSTDSPEMKALKSARDDLGKKVAQDKIEGRNNEASRENLEKFQKANQIVGMGELGKKEEELSNKKEKFENAINTGKYEDGQVLTNEEMDSIKNKLDNVNKQLDVLKPLKESSGGFKDGSVIEMTGANGEKQQISINGEDTYNKLVKAAQTGNFSNYQITTNPVQNGNTTKVDENDYT